MPSDKNSSNDITIHQKYLEKIVKMQQDQEVARQQEYELLTTHLAQMNVFLDRLISVSGSGSTVAATKKTIPFQTGSQTAGQLNQQPDNPDLYPTRVDVYSINDSKVISHMTLINDGPGDIFFIGAYAKNIFNVQEGHLNVNDQRELFNVYEIRLRSTLPKTTFRLIEGIFRTGSFAPQTKANVEIRPSIQPNEKQKVFDTFFDIAIPNITITQPTVQNLIANFIRPAFMAPLPPGATAAFVDTETGFPMPFTIPAGSILETFAFYGNTSTDYTLRNYVEFKELTPGQFTLFNTLPMSNRGTMFGNQVLNLNIFSTQAIDTFGAPPGGRRVLLTVTNDDPFNNLIGDIFFTSILRQLREV